MHLLYTRFQSASHQLSPLIGELERRALKHPNELNALLTECQLAFLNARKGLLLKKIVDDIKGLDPSRTELVELVRRKFSETLIRINVSKTREGCSYLKQLCTDEFNIYGQFFSTGEDQI